MHKLILLADRVGRAAQELEPMDVTLDRYADLPQFKHLENYDSLTGPT